MDSLLPVDATSSYSETENDDVERAKRAELWAAHDEGERRCPTRARETTVEARHKWSWVRRDGSCSQVKGHPFEVRTPDGLLVAGVVLSDQAKSLDWRARGAEFACRRSSETTADVRRTQILGDGCL